MNEKNIRVLTDSDMANVSGGGILGGYFTWASTIVKSAYKHRKAIRHGLHDGWTDAP